MLRALVSAALVLFVTSALPLRAPARGAILSTCRAKPWRGCPEEGGDLREKLTGFSEAMVMYGSTSDKSGSTAAWTGENGLDRAASKVFATSVAVTMARLQLYQNDAANGGVDEEEAAQGYLGRALVKLLAILLELVLGLFVFGRIIPRRSSSAKGAAWRSYVVSYLLISPEIALVAAAATSVRGSDYTITKSSKIKTNESPSSSVQSLEQRRVLSGYVMTDSNIRTAVAAWASDASAAETTYGHISTWDTSGVTDMSWLFYDTNVWVQESAGCTGACLFNDDISAWDTSGVKKMHSMFYGAASFNRNIGSWATSSVTDMESMFESAKAFNQPIGSWDVSSVIKMRDMFNYASSFNQPLGDWDVRSVTHEDGMYRMFYDASAFNQPLGNWDVSNVVEITTMFAGAAPYR